MSTKNFPYHTPLWTKITQWWNIPLKLSPNFYYDKWFKNGLKLVTIWSQKWLQSCLKNGHNNGQKTVTKLVTKMITK